MFHADLVVGADDGALEEAPHAFDAVGVHVADDPFLCRMVDGLMARVMVREPQVTAQLVGVEGFGLVFGDGLHEGMKGFFLDVGDVTEFDVAATLQGASDVDTLRTLREAHGLVPVPAMPLVRRQHRLVQFDDAKEGRSAVGGLHGFPDAVAEIPCRLVRGADGALHLIRAHGLLAFDHEVGGSEPLPERELGVVEECPRGDGETETAGVAIVLVAAADRRDGLARALGASDAIGPAELFEVVPANLFGPEAMDDIHETGGFGSIQCLELSGVGLTN